MTTHTETLPAAIEVPERRKGLLHYLGLGLSFGLLAFVGLIAMLVVVLPVATGSTAYTIMTGSMEPHYPPGTLVIVKPTAIEDIAIGDIVTYQIESGKDAVVTHRVVQVVHASNGESRLITQGDANDAKDAGEVQSMQVRGTVWYAVPWIGWVNNVISGGTRAIVVPILAGALFLYAGYMVASHIIGRRRAERRRAAERLAAASVAQAEVEAPAAEPVKPAGAAAAKPTAKRVTEPADGSPLRATPTPEPIDDRRTGAVAEPELVPSGLSRFAPRP